MWNFGYHLARAKGAAIRRSYIGRLETIARQKADARQSLELDVFSYSGEAALPEQVASIRSFLKHAGRPRSFNVVSDGTYSHESESLLRALDPAVRFHSAPPPPPSNLPTTFQNYLREHPTGRQLALIMSLPGERSALYVDSDVLFFAGAKCIEGMIREQSSVALYLQDCQFSGDDRLLLNGPEQQNPINTGVALFHGQLDWSIAVKRFEKLADAAPTFFTNQTLTHLALHANSAFALDARKFVLQLDDQFIYADRYAGPEIALRHYVNPVRHKFWTSLARAS